MNIHIISAYIHWSIARIAKSFNPKNIVDIGGIGKANHFIECDITEANIINNIDATNLPYANNSFDVAISIATLEHTDDHIKFISESARISRVAAVHWFPAGEAARKAEQLKEKLGHTHPCTIPLQEDIESALRDLNLHGRLSTLMTIGEHLLLLATIYPQLNTPKLYEAVRRIGSEPYGMTLTITHCGDFHDTQ